MRSKDFDDFSFKGPPKSQPSQGQISSKQEIEIERNQININPKDINYRHLQNKNIPSYRSDSYVFDNKINSKIDRINQQLDQNIKRRLQLQQKLQIVKEQENKIHQRQIFMGYHPNYKQPEQQISNFRRMQQKANKINLLIEKQEKINPKEDKIINLQKKKQILLNFQQPIKVANKQHILIPIIQQFASKVKPIPVYTVPNQIKIQNLLRRTTFPQIPKQNLEILKKEIEHLFALHSPHSDIHFLLMIIYFHLKKYMKVRKHYQQIINFKIFSPQTHWIAAQAEFCMENYDLCLKLTEECMNKLQQKYLPRFIYLKAKSYEHICNYVNSLICYNQLIKLKPKISEYYLQRGIIYHRIGYYMEAKQDFITFGILKPEAQKFIKDKVLSQQNEHKKKELIAVLAKIF